LLLSITLSQVSFSLTPLRRGGFAFEILTPSDATRTLVTKGLRQCETASTALAGFEIAVC
jgi:hypothetical protein